MRVARLWGKVCGFFVRIANSNSYAANSSIKLANDSYWHFVVGVCDEANSNLSLYVDNNLVATGAIPSQSGIINSASVPVMIGARSLARYSAWKQPIQRPSQ